MPTKPFFKCYFHAGDQRIRYNRDHERILLTVWRNGRLTGHKIHHLSRAKDGGDFFFHAGQMFYVSEFIDPHGSYHLAS